MNRENGEMSELDELVDKVVGAAIAVHRELGPGFTEATYHKALEVELEARHIGFESEVSVALQYRSKIIGRGRIDVLVENQLVVELKAVERSAKSYRRQVVAYLKATGLSLGIVINFETDLIKHGLARVSCTNQFTTPRLRASASSAKEIPATETAQS